ncbi:thiamine phosphate synthase [Mangrovivirga cuniculi]|uniref:Uncharacterized protein n=1 Tax=Mangrovivirga cuniculi TaxID=2715131 RepID=A0A4D7JNU5_9BACT|nr:hypothetical protein DCC35_06710 [Mangrovivirga cuniculi]
MHFDEIPRDFDRIKSNVPNNRIFGLTVNNDLDIIKEAIDYGFDYLSFCTVFPSETNNSCELVDPKIVKKLPS